MLTLRSLKIALAAAAIALAPLTALAETGDPISVKVNMARILRISTRPLR